MRTVAAAKRGKWRLLASYCLGVSLIGALCLQFVLVLVWSPSPKERPGFPSSLSSSLRLRRDASKPGRDNVMSQHKNQTKTARDAIPVTKLADVRKPAETARLDKIGTFEDLMDHVHMTPRQVLLGDCCEKDHEDLHGVFVAESLNYMRHIMYRLHHKLPFAHVRWGDGEIQTASGASAYGQSLAQSLLILAQHPLASVNVGMWWLNRPALKQKWNAMVPNNNQSVFQDTFYLPNGEVVNDGMPRFRSEGIEGWIPIMDRANLTVVLVGPLHLTEIPFLKKRTYISATKVEHNLAATKDLVQKMIKVAEAHEEKQEAVLFLLSCGRSAKIAIADMLSRPGNIHSFIDTGSSLDAYAGIQSRDYNNPRVYCDKIKERDADRINYWMKAGVCDKYKEAMKILPVHKVVKKAKILEYARGKKTVAFNDTMKHAGLTPRQVLLGDCCENNHDDLHGLFVAESLKYMRHVMYRLVHKLPFAHVRWGDGEMQTASLPTDYGASLAQSLLVLAQHPLASVNVGMWWLNRPALKQKWNAVVPDSNQSIFQDTFYLPNGEVVNDGTPRFQSEGIDGWIPIVARVNYTVVLVGPLHLQDVPFLGQAEFIPTGRVEHNLAATTALEEEMKKAAEKYEAKQEPVLFLVSCGRSAKIVIADMLSRPGNIHSFIDTGSSLDAYAGIKSRDYNDPKVYCAKIEERDAARMNYWMKAGVCDKYKNAVEVRQIKI